MINNEIHILIGKEKLKNLLIPFELVDIVMINEIRSFVKETMIPIRCTKCGSTTITPVHIEPEKCTIYVCNECEGFCTIKDVIPEKEVCMKNNKNEKQLPEIEPCPFCLSPRVELHRNFDYVKCLSCGASGHVFDGHPYDAIVTWNSVSLQSQAVEIATQKAMKIKQEVQSDNKGLSNTNNLRLPTLADVEQEYCISQVGGTYVSDTEISVIKFVYELINHQHSILLAVTNTQSTNINQIAEEMEKWQASQPVGVGTLLRQIERWTQQLRVIAKNIDIK